MEFLGLAAGAASGTAMNVYSYNRVGFFTDVVLSQCRRLAKNNIILAQAGMYREDIRNAVASAMQRQQNYILIATLVFSSIAGSFCMQEVPKDTPRFVSNLYMLCLATALFFELVSAVCAIASNHLTNDCQNEMLLNEVRLPVEALIRDTDAKSRQECVEAFEHQAAGRLLRPPFLNRVSGEAPQPLEEGEAVLEESLYRPLDLDLMHKEREKFMGSFRERAKHWNMLNQLSLLFLGLGLSNLLQGYGFYYAAHSSQTGGHWDPSVQVFCVLTDVFITWAHSSYLGVASCAIMMEVLLLVTGQVLCAIVIQLQGSPAVLISFCYVIRIFVNAWGTWGIFEVALKSNRPSNYKAAIDVIEDGLGSSSSESSASEQDQNRRRAPSKNISRCWHVFLFVCAASLTFPWVTGLVWSTSGHAQAFPVAARKLKAMQGAALTSSSEELPAAQKFKDMVSTIRNELGIETNYTLAEVIVEANHQLGLEPHGSLAQQGLAILKLIAAPEDQLFEKGR